MNFGMQKKKTKSLTSCQCRCPFLFTSGTLDEYQNGKKNEKLFGTEYSRIDVDDILYTYP